MKKRGITIVLLFFLGVGALAPVAHAYGGGGGGGGGGYEGVPTTTDPYYDPSQDPTKFLFEDLIVWCSSFLLVFGICTRL